MLNLKQIESFYPERLRPFQKNLLREYLQYKILEAIFASKFAKKLFFMGGTAIHIIHSNNRFSEDLDFDNIALRKSEFLECISFIQKRLRLEGYITEARNSFRGAYRAYLKIPDILYENHISKHAEEKLLIEIDTEPQGFNYQPSKVILNKFDVFARINVVPSDILLAQKLYAIFMRRRPMGRDFYDAIFLFGKTKPNLNYLKLKLGIKDIAALKERILNRCKALDFKQLSQDVEPFLFSPSDAKKILLFLEYVKNLPE